MKNTFRPTSLHYKNSYGWAGSQKYNPRDIPDWRAGSNRSREILEQQFAYEWFDYSSKLRGDRRGGPNSNPVFRSGAAGRLLPFLVQHNGQAARVLRGFIRRAEYDRSDPVSMARLYFMYNPEVIVRDYVSYLDQGALDPFNTVFDSKNLVAPPSFMDFSFDLFFDRMDEAQARGNPGVYVDYEYFDLVVRNVVPTPNSKNNQLPDNGVMMVNPRDITVVFSPNLTVQGRPLNARVSFERFTHRMVPTRMRISLTMRVIYMGPMKDFVEYKNEEFGAAQTIPYDALKPKHYDFTYKKLTVEPVDLTSPPGGPDDVRGKPKGANGRIRAQVLDYARAQVALNNTEYEGPGPGRLDLWNQADCSSLILGAYIQKGYGEAMNWTMGDWTGSMMDRWLNEPWRTADHLWGSEYGGLAAHLDMMQYGDIVWKPGHIAFFSHVSGGRVYLFHARGEDYSPQVGLIPYYSTEEGVLKYTYGVRPLPAGRDAVTNSGGSNTRRNDEESGPV